MVESDHHREAKHLDEWIRWTFRENNFEKLTEIYRNLPKVLDTIFEQWMESSNSDLLADVLGLLLPGYSDNLFAVIWREEAKFNKLPFQVRKLPGYAQWLLQRRNLKGVPPIYERYKITLDDGLLHLSIRDYYIFTFLYHATKDRGAGAPAWFESPTFLGSIYTNPYLILYSQMVVNLDPNSLLTLVQVTEEFLINPISRRPMEYMEDWRLPRRHECELLVLLLYVLGSPLHLLTESHKIQSIRPDALLLSLGENFYRFFKNCCLHWNSDVSYPASLSEVWLCYLSPWKTSRILDDFLGFDFLRGQSKYEENSREFQQTLVYYSGSELFWEDYVTENLLCYTELFEIVMKMLCGQLLMRSGDIDLIRRISDLFSVDEDGRTVHGHLNIYSLDEMSQGAKLTQDLEAKLRLHTLDPRVLSPFTNPRVGYIIETLYFKAGQMGSGLTAKIAQNWKHVFHLESIAEKSDFPVLEDEGKWRRPGDLQKTMVPVWQRPLRSDEWWVLFWAAWGCAVMIDRCRKVRSTVPQTNLRFLASYLNLLYLTATGLCVYWLALGS